MSGHAGERKVPAVDLDKVNAALVGFTRIVRFDLQSNGTHFELALTLAKRHGADRLTLRCREVQHLELNPTGDGFAELTKLQISDLREEGLDRVQFALEEIENETLFLHCADFMLEGGEG